MTQQLTTGPHEHFTLHNSPELRRPRYVIASVCPAGDSSIGLKYSFFFKCDEAHASTDTFSTLAK